MVGAATLTKEKITAATERERKKERKEGRETHWKEKLDGFDDWIARNKETYG